MAKYAISEEGVSQLQKLSKSIISDTENIYEAGISLKNNISSLGEGLGIYENEIIDLVNHNQATLQSNREVFKQLSDSIIKKADEICGLMGFSAMNIGDSLANGNTQSDSSSICASSTTNSNHSFTPLLITAQEFEHVKLNGKDVTIFDHPFEHYNKNNICNQGSAYPNGPTGTCGNCASGSIMNKAGFNYTEYDVVTNSLAKGYCSSTGGTSPDSWVKILDDMAGIKSTASYSESLENLAAKVEEGKGVIIAVNAKLYRPEWYGPYDPNNSAGHALVLDSVIRDEKTGEILEYVVTDSNGDSQSDACHRIDKNILERAYYGFGKKSVVTDEIIW